MDLGLPLFEILSISANDVLCLKTILGFLLSERTSGVSPVIVYHKRYTSGQFACFGKRQKILTALLPGTADNAAGRTPTVENGKL